MKEALPNYRRLSGGRILPGYIYNAMIAPVTNFRIAGTIWYQGEANTSIPSTYERTLTSMIGAWRKAFDKDFPFYYVQMRHINMDRVLKAR